MIYILIFTLGLLISWLGTRYLCLEQNKSFLLDIPNDRSLHSQPIPRSGGIAILVSIFFTASLLVWLVDFRDYIGIYLASLVLALVSLYDDRNHIKAHFRLMVHITIAFLLVYFELSLTSFQLPGIDLEISGWLNYIISILIIVWLINLFNFMDGMDGFAGGMALVGFSTFIILGWLHNDSVFMYANIGIVAAVLGFLFYNFPPARIFMGDSGSSVLGLFVISIILIADIKNLFPFWIGVLVFSPFIVDASVTLVHRLLKFEKIWEAHRSHFYQRLVQHGWGHKKTVLHEYVLMLCCGISAIVAVQSTEAIQLGILIGWCIIYLGLILYLSKYLNKVRS